MDEPRDGTFCPRIPEPVWTFFFQLPDMTNRLDAFFDIQSLVEIFQYGMDSIL